MSKLFFGLSGFLLLFALLFYYQKQSHITVQPPETVQSPTSASPAAQNLQATLNQTAQQQYDAAISGIELDFKAGRISLDEAVSRRADAKVVLDHNTNVANTVYPKNCPDTKSGIASTTKIFDLTGCKSGTHIQLHFGDVLKPAQWKVTQYRFGTAPPQTELENKMGKQLIELPTEADIEVLVTNHDDGSRVKLLSPHLFEWVGFVKFIYHGDADGLVLERVSEAQ